MMKSLGLLFAGIFVGAVAYELVQRSYPDQVTALRTGAGRMVDGFLGTSGEQADESAEEAGIQDPAV